MAERGVRQDWYDVIACVGTKHEPRKRYLYREGSDGANVARDDFMRRIVAAKSGWVSIRHGSQMSYDHGVRATNPAYQTEEYRIYRDGAWIEPPNMGGSGSLPKMKDGESEHEYHERTKDQRQASWYR